MRLPKVKSSIRTQMDMSAGFRTSIVPMRGGTFWLGPSDRWP